MWIVNIVRDYWNHSGSATDLYNVIREGVPDKGMVSWKGNIKPKERLAVISYIKYLYGINPPNAKEPQGELWKDGLAAPALQDSTAKNPVALEQAAKK